MEEQKKKAETNQIAVGMAQGETVQRYGEAASQMRESKTGIRVDSSGNQIEHNGRSLDQISRYSTGNGTAKQQEQIRKSQSGFDAELISEARSNKEAILEGKSTRRRTTDGIGRTNDPRYDHVDVDNKGNVIPGSESQMKFYGIDGKGRYKVIEKYVNDPSWSRYDGRPIDVPSEQYEGAVQYAQKCADNLQNQANRLRTEGNIEKANELSAKADKYKRASKAIRKSNVSSAEAMEARDNPFVFTEKEVLRDSHNAGLEAAKSTMILSASISMAQNFYAVYSGDKELDEAVEDVAKTTVTSGVTAYGVSAIGTEIKSVMHSSCSEAIRKMGVTDFPTAIVVAAAETAKSLKRYAEGDINEEELILELGEKGTGMIAAGYGTYIGSMLGGIVGSVIPGVGTMIGGTVGGFVGSMIGYNSSSVLYLGALETLQEERISEERKVVVQRLAEQAIEENNRYQNQLESYARKKYIHREYQMKIIFQNLDESMKENDIDSYIENLAKLGNIYGLKLKFESFDEFDSFMRDKDSILVLS